MRSSHFIRPRAGIILMTAISVVLFFLMLPGGQRVLALNGEEALSQYNLRVWQTRDGLPQNTVQAIAQTRDGYLWLGTQEGLVRFDGVRFQIFDRRNTPQMQSNFVRVVLESRHGGLWIATDGGLLHMRDGQFTSYTTRDGLAHNFVFALCETDDGSIWAGTVGGGLNRLSDGKFTHYSTEEGLLADVVVALHAGADGSIWVGTTKGLNRINGERIDSYTTADGLANNRVQAICDDGAGGVWVGTEGGLHHLIDARFKLYTKRERLTDDNIRALYQDGAGTLWIGTTSGGLNRFRESVFDSFTQRDGLSHNYVWSLSGDREGNLWVGTSNGLNRLADAKFTSYTKVHGLPAQGVWSVLEDHTGTVWVGTDSGGLSRLAGESFINYLAREGVPSGGVLSLYEDAAGDIWVGSLGVLLQFRGGRVRRTFTARDGLAGNDVRAICADAEGRLWIGTTGGLNKLEHGRLTRLTTRDGLANDSIRALHFDRAGHLWIATIGGGLDRLRDGVFTNYTTEQGMPSNSIRSIYEDADGTLWIGTNGGLVRLRDNSLTVYTSAEGMSDDTVMGMVEDDTGHFWMASNKGIFRTSKRGLEDFAAGRASKITGQSFGMADGMPSAECNGVSQPSAIKTRDGRLWFATVGGMAVVDPRKLRTNSLPPPVVIEEMLVDDKAVGDVAGRAAARVHLEPGAQRIEFHYTGLSYVAPEHVRFRYQLEGFDQVWIEVGTRRAAYYTNLPPGRYRFQVVAANADGVWNTVSKSIEFEVRPHFFQTRWFYALCVAATLALAWGLYLLRVRRIQRQFALVLAERTRVAREMHDTLIQGVVGASTLLEAVAGVLPQTTSPAYGYLERARDQLRQSLDEARRAVWDLRNPAAQTQDLATALRQTVENLAAGAAAEIEMEQTGRARRLTGARAESLLRVALEAVTNAVTHAGARRIKIQLHFDARSVRLSVGDDGRGFDASQTLASGGDNHHFGLVGMRERAEACGGHLTIESAPGSGTTIIATLPV